MSQEQDNTPNSIEKPRVNMRLVLIALSGALLITGFYTFLYFSQPVVKQTLPLCDDFNALAPEVQAEYVSAQAYAGLEQEIRALKTQITAQTATDAAFETLQAPQETAPESSSVMEASAEVSQEAAPVSGVARVKNAAKCYDMESAAQKLSQACRKTLIDYVDAHPQAKYFEIIGVVDDQEFNLFNNLERRKNLYKTLGVDQRVVDKMKDLARRGLSKIRAAEASWVIKTHTDHKAATYNANYEIVSPKGYRGVIVWAYEVAP